VLRWRVQQVVEKLKDLPYPFAHDAAAGEIRPKSQADIVDRGVSLLSRDSRIGSGADVADELAVGADRKVAIDLIQRHRHFGFRPVMEVAGLTICPPSRRGASGLHAHRVRVSPGRRVPPDPLAVHQGHHWIYVLQRRMRLLLGEADLIIAPGDVVEFTT
jgi:hypothetical protein